MCVVRIIIVLLSLSVLSGVALSSDPAKLPTVVVIATGGTIAEKQSEQAGGAVPALTGKNLMAAVPGINQLANIRVKQFSNIDSSHMTPQVWKKLSALTSDILQEPNVAGVVIIHGTDTMAEGAYFLDLTLKSKKPVVFVGAMRAARTISSDGPANIYNAVLQVVSPAAKNWGVTVSMNQYINSARDVRKTQSTNVQTFKSGPKGYLGYVAMNKVVRYNERLKHLYLPLPKELPKVALLNMYAGADGRFIRHAVDSGIKGIVVNAVGAGNVNPEVYHAIQYALSKKVSVVIATRVYHGGFYPSYGDVGGGAMLMKNGAISAGDLTPPKARILLMLAMPAAKGDPEKLQKLFLKASH